MISYYWFFNHGFKCQDYLCNGCCDLEILCFNTNDIAIINVKFVDYRSIIHIISIFQAISLLEKFCS